MVEDYPYGYRLRTQIRYWIETKLGYGQRMVSQTENPKTGRWNKPKPSTYSRVLALYLDDVEHVHVWALNAWATEEQIAEFEALFPLLAADDHYTREQIRYLRAMNRASTHLSFSVQSHVCSLRDDCAGCQMPRQTLQEQAVIVGKVIRHELWQDALAAIRGTGDNA